MSSTIEKWMQGRGPKRVGGNNPGSINDSPNTSKGHSYQGNKHLKLDYDRLAAEGYIANNANKDIVEEYRLIKRRLLKTMSVDEVPYPNIILVTSSLQGDGKTFTAINLALSLAMEIDRTVLLIDGDVIKSGIGKTLNIPSDTGLVDLLANDSHEFSETIYKTDIPNLSVLPSGRSNSRNTELLSSDRMRDFCQEISRRYPDRLIIIDSPPILQTTESQALAHILHHIVFVVSAGHTSTTAMKSALELMEKEKNIQFILNKARLRTAGMYYYYGESEKDK